MEFQERIITAKHYLSCGGEGLVVRIKNTSEEEADIVG